MPEFDSTHIVQAIGAVKMPFGEYTNFQDCVDKNRGKVSDPEAYCAVIKRKVEGEEINVANEVLMTLGQLEGDFLKNAQLMPIGKWHHPLGKIEVTPEKARSFAAQFKRSVTGQKLPILWIHSEKDNVANPRYGRAAGWITDMRADDQLGVLVDIELTPEASLAVKNKEYAYLSAEYFEQVQLPHHDAPESDVIVAAALVNRPHLKGMNPLLNEETGHQFMFGQADQPITGGVMDKILLQLCESAGIKLEDKQSELTDAQRASLTTYLEKKDKDLSDSTAKVTLLESQVSKLEDPDSKKARNLEEAGFKEEARLLSEYRADRFVTRLAEDVPSGKILSPAAKQTAREYALEQTSANLEALHKVLLSETGVVELGERGRAGEDENENESDATSLGDKIVAEAQKIADTKQISLGEAMSEYSRANPKEWNEYQKAMGAPRAALMASNGR